MNVNKKVCMYVYQQSEWKSLDNALNVLYILVFIVCIKD